MYFMSCKAKLSLYHMENFLNYYDDLAKQSKIVECISRILGTKHIQQAHGASLAKHIKQVAVAQLS